MMSNTLYNEGIYKLFMSYLKDITEECNKINMGSDYNNFRTTLQNTNRRLVELQRRIYNEHNGNYNISISNQILGHAIFIFKKVINLDILSNTSDLPDIDEHINLVYHILHSYIIDDSKMVKDNNKVTDDILCHICSIINILGANPDKVKRSFRSEVNDICDVLIGDLINTNYNDIP